MYTVPKNSYLNGEFCENNMKNDSQYIEIKIFSNF